MLPSKWEKIGPLFYKINTYLQKTTTCTGLQAEQILSVKIWNIYIFNLGWGFCDFFLFYFQKLQLLVEKKFVLTFAALYFFYLSKIFKILFQAGNINIFVFHGIFYNRSAQLKSYFSDKKSQQWNLRNTSVEKMLNENTSRHSNSNSSKTALKRLS